MAGSRVARNLTGPQHQGYRPDEEPRELMAEAIRAYLADPNYLKTVAPKTAKAIREAVNRNPEINRIIQFNSPGWAPFALGAGAAAGSLLDSGQE